MAAFAESVLVSFPVVVLVVEVALASPLARLIQTLAVKGRKSARLLRNRRVSDHWKEQILPTYALTMLQASLLILAWLTFLSVIFALGLYIGAWVFADDFEGILVLQRADYLLSSFLVAVAYLIARRLVRNVREFTA